MRLHRRFFHARVTGPPPLVPTNWPFGTSYEKVPGPHVLKPTGFCVAKVSLHIHQKKKKSIVKLFFNLRMNGPMKVRVRELRNVHNVFEHEYTSASSCSVQSGWDIMCLQLSISFLPEFAGNGECEANARANNVLTWLNEWQRSWDNTEYLSKRFRDPTFRSQLAFV